MASKARPSRLDKALQERMYFISHIPATASTLAHSVLVTGQSGNLYTVTLPTTASQHAQCNCIDQRIRKTLCKHMLFTLLRVLKIPRSALPTTDHNAVPALSTSLLPTLLDALSRAPGTDVQAPARVRGAVATLAPRALPPHGATVPRRRVDPRHECPICFDAFAGERLAFCERGCGNGVHAACFARYARVARGAVRCVLCRAAWADGGAEEIGKRGLLVGRRLVNVAEVVPEAFVVGGVRRLGLDRFGEERRVVVGRRRSVGKVEKEIKKGKSERELRARAREERRRVAEGKGIGKGKGRDGGAGRRVTRSMRGT